ncbi:uncharacterized protein GGS25DRAFT_387684 [Hypoxylon fragiforme]|uniref:uncharacterized protein n=1 Tax=Hypoxylon fragiforme TaxID=63214 RepID=UPI0020C728AC|nr:uncharacterized protein GGS25DRAFT_387684 [Hypoxylon fragiforme]KAI2606379.1 hypothetical protein GGS25DRAFT_387684 [Hypoxylon fragiforme]
MIFPRKDTVLALFLFSGGASTQDLPRHHSLSKIVSSSECNGNHFDLPVTHINATVTTSVTKYPTSSRQGVPNDSTSTRNTIIPTVAGSPSPPFSNVTETGAGLTTLTVSLTSVETVISCASTINGCTAATDYNALSSLPREALSTMLVTKAIGITTTVCPVTEASAVSSSIVASLMLSALLVNETDLAFDAGTTKSSSSLEAGGISVENVPVSNTMITSTITQPYSSSAISPVESVITTTISASSGASTIVTTTTETLSSATVSTIPPSSVTVTLGIGTGSEATTSVVIIPPYTTTIFRPWPPVATKPTGSGGESAAEVKTVTVWPLQSVVTTTILVTATETVSGGGAQTTTVFSAALSTVTVTEAAASTITTTVGEGGTMTIFSTLLPEGMCACSTPAV